MSADTKRKRIDWLLLLLIIPGLVCALVLASHRQAVERANSTVELTLDLAELLNLSAATNTPLPKLLSEFKQAGAAGIAINEVQLGELVSNGQISYEQLPLDRQPATRIRIHDRSVARMVFHAWVALTSGPNIGARIDPDVFLMPGVPATLDAVGCGLPRDSVRLVKSAGMDVVARLVNYPSITERAIAWSAVGLKRDNIVRVVCSGDEIVGFKGLVPYFAEVVKQNGLVYGSVEFAKQKGDARLSAALDSSLVRVHSIAYVEMAGMTPPDAVERFVRAVRERNIRLCYVRLLATNGDNAASSNVDFVRAISSGLRNAGYTMGPAAPFREMHRPRLLLALMALSVAAGFVLLLSLILSIRPLPRYALLIVFGLAAVGMSAVGERGIQLLALSAALVFPTLGAGMLLAPHFRGEEETKASALRAVVLFLAASVVTLWGALLVVGFLADRSYVVKVNQFVGIKAAHLLPMLAVVLIMVSGLPIFDKPRSGVWEDVRSNWRKAAAHPMFFWHAFAIAALLGIVGLALLRTGNEPGVGVSGLELQFRALLDKILVVRPRTKEFMLGHPAMLLGIALLLTRRRNWGLPLIALGMLGQVSLLNTFCHIHTPLQVSMLRAANGLVLGVLVGLVLWVLFSRAIPPDAVESRQGAPLQVEDSLAVDE